MKINQLYITTFVILGFFSSCKKAVLGEEPTNDPETNFELLWNDFDKHYGLFIARGIDWDSVYSVYRPQVTAQTTDLELWDIATEMIEILDDEHTFLYDTNRDFFYGSGSEFSDIAVDEFDRDQTLNTYVETLTDLTGDKEFSYGKLKNHDIGYIYLGRFDDMKPKKIDQVIDDLKGHQAIILDVRNNGGGFDQYAERIAGAFADSEKFIYTVETRNGPEHDDFDEIRKYYSKKHGDEQFTKPVILLTDRYTISAGEIFLLHMNSFGHVVQMGDTTAGDFSDGSAERFLPNGWLYRYSIQQFLLPDGSSLDGIGHVPDEYVKNTIDDIKAGKDLVMDRAFEYLKEEYNIE